jgi:hypothetical protein
MRAALGGGWLASWPICSIGGVKPMALFAGRQAIDRHLMLYTLASCIMRTTLDIDDPVLREVKALHEKEGRSMGAVVSELLADALARRRASHARPAFSWVSRPMGALVDLSDKEAVHAVLDAGSH